MSLYMGFCTIYIRMQNQTAKKCNSFIHLLFNINLNVFIPSQWESSSLGVMKKFEYPDFNSINDIGY